jgi:arginine repressor
MPTKYIDKKIWDKIEEWTIKATIENQKITKETEILEFLLDRGIKATKETDLKELIH